MNKSAKYLLVFLLACYPICAEELKVKDSSHLVGSSDEQQKLSTLYEDYWDFLMQEYPESATMAGFSGYNNRWKDYSVGGIQRRNEAYQAFAKSLRTIDRDCLKCPYIQLNYDILEWELQSKLEAAKFDDEYIPITPFDGIQIDIPQVLLSMPKETAVQAEDMLSRLKAVPHLLDEVLVLLNVGLEKGISPPQIILKEVPQQITNLLTCNPKESALFLPFTQLSEKIPQEERKKIQHKALKILVNKVFPAFCRLKRYLINAYIPRCRETTSLKDLPNGAEWYQHKIHFNTTLNLSPEQIHSLGLNEVQRIQGEIDKILSEVGYEGNFEQFIQYINTDSRFFFDNAQSLLEAYRDKLKLIEEQLPRLFGKLPEVPLEIVPIPPYSEASQIAAYYYPGSLDWGRPGYFFVNTYDLATRPKWEMDVLSLHEALPGHHLQISISQQLQDIPEFRKHTYFAAFAEGWALYAESLGKDLGVYQDPYSRFGQLSYEIFRAARLVVDTGLHHLGWSRQQAIDYLKNTTGMNENEVIREVDRYLSIPGQALSYKIGEMKIKEWRDLAKQELQDRFDIRDFHDELLSYGSALPLNILESQIKEWLSNPVSSQ